MKDKKDKELTPEQLEKIAGGTGGGVIRFGSSSSSNRFSSSSSIRPK